jgi:DNA-binding transcriptional ArsR family regulator
MARDSDPSTTIPTEVTVSLTAELLFAADQVAAAPDRRTLADPAAVARLRGDLPPRVLKAAERLQGFWWTTMGLVDYLCWNGQFQDPQAFCQDVLATPITQFLPILFNGDLTPDQVAPLIAAPDTAANLGPRVSKFSQGTPEAYVALFRDPEGHRQALVDLVLACDVPWFRESVEALRQTVAPTIRDLENRLRAEDPLTVAESLRDKAISRQRVYDRCTFVVTRWMATHYIQCIGAGRAAFFVKEGTPILVGPSRTGTELAEVLKVLGDKTRMDILRLASCGPTYGKELAASLGLTTATVSRHLDQLKAVGLIREDRADANNVKVLRYEPQILDKHLERLRAYLYPTS